MCEHPKKDSAHGDRFVELFQDCFYVFNFCQVGGLTIVPNRNELNLGRGQTIQSKILGIPPSSQDL
jgi:hypothetical protein